MDSESSLTSFPSFCTQPSEVAALFNSNLSRLPFLGQVINSVLLLCRVCTGFDLEHVFLFLCHIFTQRPKNDRKVERSDVCCLGQQQLLTNSIEISFHMKKKSDLSLPEIYKALKPCWLLNWVSIARVEACFPQAPAATAADLETPCACARPSDWLLLSYPRKSCQQESCPKRLAVDFALWTFDYLLEQPSEILLDDLQGLKLGLNFELCSSCKGFIAS